MTAALLLLVAMAIIVVVWSGARLMRARELRRRGLDIGAENRRLRDDPRFTEIWVQQLRNDPPREPDDPSAT